MKTLIVEELSPIARQQWLNAAIAPRPICFASTIDRAANINLSPFSYFNIFSSNPPVVIFSASRRVRDNTTKHTLQNVMDVPEVVINICDFDMVQQVSLASCEYPKEINEFFKSGFTMQDATVVKPPMVKEAKIKLECRVLEVKSLGDQGGAGQLVLSEILVMHVDESILNEEGKIDQLKMHHVARLGGDWYSRVDEQNMFSVHKPNVELGIGVDALPKSIRHSKLLTGNNLGQLANVQRMPDVDAAFYDDRVKNIFQYYALTPHEMEAELHRYAKELLDDGKASEAWQVLLSVQVE